MKTLLLLLLNLSIAFLAFGQALDSCDSKKIVDQNDAKKFFLRHSIDVSTYDWGNNTLTCHINQAVSKHKQKTGFYVGGSVACTAGAFLVLLGAAGQDFEKGSPERNFGNVTLVTGSIFLAGGIVLLFEGAKSGKKSHYHIEQVKGYFANSTNK